MKSGFKDPIAPRSQKPKDHPVDGKPTTWDFKAPQYDQRSSCFVRAGTDYGVGFKQPVGTESVSAKSAVPYGKVDTMKIDEV